MPSLGKECFDIVWCDLILHHLVDSLDAVLRKIHRALKPVACSLPGSRSPTPAGCAPPPQLVPVRVYATPDEQPFRPSELAIVRQHFPDLHLRHYRIFARADRVTNNLSLLRLLGPG